MKSEIAPLLGPASALADETKLRAVDLLRVLLRRKLLILTCAAVLTLTGVLGIFLLPARYTATAAVMLEAKPIERLAPDAAAPPVDPTAPALRSELEILRSRVLAASVATQLRLTDSPTFMKEARREPLWRAVLPSAAKRWLETAAFGGAPRPMPDLELAAERLQQVVAIANDGISFVITISAEAATPDLAARIANGYADRYLDQRREQRAEEMRRTSADLDRQMAAERERLELAEDAVATFRAAHNLTEFKRGTIADQRISDLNEQLALATADRAQKETTLRQLAGMESAPGGIAAAAPVLASPLIQNLQLQLADVRRRRAELSSMYGPSYPAMIHVAAEERDIEAKIANEVAKVRVGLIGEVDAARAKEESLRSSLDGLERTTVRLSGSEVTLLALMREAKARETIYDQLLTRAKESAALADLQRPGARLVERASPPYRPSFPKIPLLSGVALAASLALSVLIAFAVEHFEDVFRSAGELEESGVPAFGLVPKVEGGLPCDELVARPTSAYAEATRSVFAMLRRFSAETGPKVVLVTSSVPGEGKSQLAASLARSAAQAGVRALLVDCDFRRPSVARMMGGPESPGAMSDLGEGAQAADLVAQDPRTGLHYLRADGTGDAQTFLGSRRMWEALDRLRRGYDLILLDAAPVLAVSDPMLLCDMADLTVFVVRWGHTPRPVVRNALKMLRPREGRVAAVISQVDLRRHAQYGYGDYGYFAAHYGRYYEQKS